MSSKIGIRDKKQKQPLFTQLQSSKLLAQQYRVPANIQLQTKSAIPHSIENQVPQYLQKIQGNILLSVRCTFRDIINQIQSFNTFYSTDLNINKLLQKVVDDICFFFDAASSEKQSLADQRISLYRQKYNIESDDDSSQSSVYKQLYENQITITKQEGQKYEKQIELMQTQIDQLRAQLDDKVAQYQLETLELQKSRIIQLESGNLQIEIQNKNLKQKVEQITKQWKETKNVVADLQSELLEKKQLLMQSQNDVNDLIAELQSL